MISNKLLKTAPYDWTKKDVLAAASNYKSELRTSNENLLFFEAVIYNWYDLGDQIVVKLCSDIIPKIDVMDLYRALHVAWIRADGFIQLKEVGMKRLKSLSPQSLMEIDEHLNILFDNVEGKFNVTRDNLKIELGIL